jgi:hypothetical protein
MNAPIYPEYRLYIDETGNPDLRASTNPNHRYLSLTGIAIRIEDAKTQLFPAFERIKTTYFGQTPGNPVVFHRSAW